MKTSIIVSALLLAACGGDPQGRVYSDPQGKADCPEQVSSFKLLGRDFVPVPADRSLSVFASWLELVERLAQESCHAAGCVISPWRLIALSYWDEQLDKMAELDLQEQLEAVNQFVNEWTYQTDLETYGVSDHWATPVELMSHSGGDCEDLAVAKLVSLQRLGFEERQLRLVQVHDVLSYKQHIVLVAMIDGQGYLLDNQNRRVIPQEQNRRYYALFAMGFDGLWISEALMK